MQRSTKMVTESKNSIVIEKTLKEQIIEKMISRLKESENFTDNHFKKLEVTDLNNKNEVKEIISSEGKEIENENTQAGN